MRDIASSGGLRLMVASVALMAGPALAQDDGLYARIDQLLAANPKLASELGKPASAMAEVNWLVGEWDVEAAVAGEEAELARGTSVISPLFGGVWLEMRDTYPDGNQDLGFLGVDPATGRWTTVGIDAYGNANISTAAGWNDSRLVFEDDFIVLGISVHLRQTFHKVDGDTFKLENEELVNGAWHPVDAYLYRRKGG